MLAFCREHGIAHERCGKVVVATVGEEVERLERLAERGAANGVAGIRMLGPEELRELEPEARGLRALHVPSTGIADYGAVARQYRAAVEGRGGVVRTGTRVTNLELGPDGISIATTSGVVRARQLVNCAGLLADRVARLAGFEPRAVASEAQATGGIKSSTRKSKKDKLREAAAKAASDGH
ncbi:MAG: FAD-dependent oxidoreductase, partial [Proteobacteria bacterium]|nr:FAD-dependent oxidoreductase [Pseudomonadota bacterium]